jgi:hypothetical protein
MATEIIVNETHLGEQPTVKVPLPPIQVAIDERKEARAKALVSLAKVLDVIAVELNALPDVYGSNAVRSLRAHYSYIRDQSQYLLTELPN